MTAQAVGDAIASKFLHNGQPSFSFNENGIVSGSNRLPVRQTVLSGPIDSNGFATFGGSTGSTTITSSGVLTATAANGYTLGGSQDRIGSISNPAWTGLSVNGTMYLYLTINQDGTCTTGSTTVAPIYQWGGAYSNSAGAFVFNIQEMSGRVGFGAFNQQEYRVYVGEVTVASCVVSVITWYAIMGRYTGQFVNTFPSNGTPVSVNSNLGLTIGVEANLEVQCITTDLGYAVGDIVTNPSMSNGSYWMSTMMRKTNTTTGFTVGTGGVALYLKSSGGAGTPTAANWAYRVTARRNW